MSGVWAQNAQTAGDSGPQGYVCQERQPGSGHLAFYYPVMQHHFHHIVFTGPVTKDQLPLDGRGDKFLEEPCAIIAMVIFEKYYLLHSRSMALP